MTTTSERLEIATQKAEAASDIAEAWANGPEYAQVDTAAGPLDTLAEFQRKRSEDILNGVRRVASVADLMLTPARYDGDSVVLPDGGFLVWNASSTAVDDGVRWFAVSGVSVGRWEFVSGQIISNMTIKIPSDFSTLQSAVDSLRGRILPASNKKIILMLEAGYVINSPLVIDGTDCSDFEIQAVDAVVPVSSGFSNTVIEVNNGGVSPTLNCLIDAANQAAGNGVRLSAGMIVVKPNKGIINAWGTGLLALDGSRFSAYYGDFSGAARNGVTGAGITSWGSWGSAEYADCTNSGYYGAQAAHGGTLAFRGGDASGAYRHGIRATDAAIVDAELAIANNCGNDGSGANVRAWEGGYVNFINGIANNNSATISTGAAFLAYGAGSTINASGATSTGNTRYGAYSQDGGKINIIDSTVTSALGDYQLAGTILRSSNDYAGTYNPVITAGSNVVSVTAQTSQYMRVGNTVTVSGSVVNIVTTAAADAVSAISVSLPIPSDFSNVRQGGGAGVFFSNSQRGNAVTLFAGVTSDAMDVQWVSKSTLSSSFTFSFTYLVI